MYVRSKSNFYELPPNQEGSGRWFPDLCFSRKVRVRINEITNQDITIFFHLRIE